MRMGIPKVITTDQGSEFRNHLNKEMTTLLGINHRLTTAYHPQVHMHALCIFKFVMHDIYNHACSVQR